MNKLTLLIGGAVLVVAVGVGIYLNYRAPQVVDVSSSDADSEEISIPESAGEGVFVQGEDAERGEQKPLVTRELQQEFVADFSNPRILVGGSQYVFVAKITKKVGNETNITWRPKTQFEAEVISNIKGDLSGKVIVSQVGGYIDGVLYVVNSDLLGPADAPGAGRLLRVGSTYLLPTRHIPSAEWGAKWYHVNSFPGVIKLISQDQNLTTSQLRDLAKNETAFRELLTTYSNEVLLDADIRNSYTQNSFQSLSAAEKQAVYDKIASFYPPPPPPLAPTSSATSTY